MRRSCPPTYSDERMGTPAEEFAKIEKWLRRKERHEPEPLSDKFFKRFAAAVAEDPVRYGRVFLHAIESARRADRK
jgi:hypothetical protein